MNRLLMSGVVLGGTVATVLTSAQAQAAEQIAVSARTYVGTSVSTPYGPVQVKVRVKNRTITSVTAVAFPHVDPKSSRINASAIPRLQQQAVVAQSASIAGVSGASWTSRAFATSLHAALVKAGVTPTSGLSTA